MSPEPRGRALRGLYAITPGEPLPRLSWEEAVEAALRGGAAVIQYRDKSADPARRRDLATALLRLCRARNVPLIINDDVDLAREVGADGVHLGREDVGVPVARSSLGPGAIIGVSCYSSVDLAVCAAAEGADYVAFGRFFPSRTKPQATPADVDVLREARRRLPSLPLVAIGGITPENGAALIAAGADMLAVIDGVFGHSGICAASRAFSRLFHT